MSSSLVTLHSKLSEVMKIDYLNIRAYTELVIKKEDYEFIDHVIFNADNKNMALYYFSSLFDKAYALKHYMILDYLLDSDYVKRDNVSSYVITAAAERGYVYVIDKILRPKNKKYFNISIISNYAIRYASANGHLEIVKMLLKDDRVDPSDLDNFAVYKAAIYSENEITKLLLKDKRVLSNITLQHLKVYTIYETIQNLYNIKGLDSIIDYINML